MHAYPATVSHRVGKQLVTKPNCSLRYQ